MHNHTQITIAHRFSCCFGLEFCSVGHLVFIQTSEFSFRSAVQPYVIHILIEILDFMVVLLDSWNHGG